MLIKVNVHKITADNADAYEEILREMMRDSEDLSQPQTGAEQAREISPYVEFSKPAPDRNGTGRAGAE